MCLRHLVNKEIDLGEQGSGALLFADKVQSKVQNKLVLDWLFGDFAEQSPPAGTGGRFSLLISQS